MMGDEIFSTFLTTGGFIHHPPPLLPSPTLPTMRRNKFVQCMFNPIKEYIYCSARFICAYFFLIAVKINNEKMPTQKPIAFWDNLLATESAQDPPSSTSAIHSTMASSGENLKEELIESVHILKKPPLDKCDQPPQKESTQ